VSEYAISTNLISWVPAKKGYFGWPQDGPEAEAVEEMQPGDALIPKFSQTPDYRRGGGYQTDYVQGICAALELDYTEELFDYERRVAGGQGAVPFVWKVVEQLPPSEIFPSAAPWSMVRIEQEELEHPISTGEFLRLRVTPIEIARQFKATAAPGRHIQKIPDGTAEQILKIGSRPRGVEDLRRLVLVRAPEGSDGMAAMAHENLNPIPGDYMFLVTENYIPGFFQVVGAHGVAVGARQEGSSIAESPGELVDLLEQAMRKVVPSDNFRPGNFARASRQLEAFIASEKLVEPIDEFANFYDRFVNLPSKVSQALEIAGRVEHDEPLVRDLPLVNAEEFEEEEEDSEQLEEESVRGLTVSAVEANLDGIELPAGVLAEAVTAIRAGKHLLLSGPPGTGKSSVAAALCRSVVGEEFQTATATADWTTFDTIGGYVPQEGGKLEFEPGIVLRCLERGRWLVIDELNRADIDKAFGPLFTLLAGAGDATGGEDVTLPFRRSEKSVRIVWADRRSNASSPYALTPSWRLIGTLNVRDKATLFQLSFAFLRRFAVIEVPLPSEEEYRRLFADWLRNVEEGPRSELVEAGMKLAFGQRQLGPAILKDIASFVRIGLTQTDTASAAAAYEDPVEAFLTAVRLFAVPQYEGSLNEEIQALLASFRGVWDEPPPAAWNALSRALADVGL
jgi:MoxR-like ATPase